MDIWIGISVFLYGMGFYIIVDTDEFQIFLDQLKFNKEYFEIMMSYILILFWPFITLYHIIVDIYTIIYWWIWIHFYKSK